MRRTPAVIDRSRVVGSPLAGWPVLLTRPVGQLEALARPLRRAGAVPVGLPAVSVRAPPDAAAARSALRAAAAATVIVFTSPSAVRFTFHATPRWRAAATARVFAIGPATARALARQGVAAQVPANGAASEALLREPALARLRGASVAIVTAPGGRETLAQALRRRGARVVFAFVYARVPARWTRRHHAALAALPTRHLSLWSSVEALATIFRRLGADERGRLLRGTAVVASDRIAAAAREAGWRRIAVARSALVADMLAAAGDAARRAGALTASSRTRRSR